MLYADLFQSREEFEQMFEHAEYRALRKKYHAVGAFPEVFDKMHSLVKPGPPESSPGRTGPRRRTTSDAR